MHDISDTTILLREAIGVILSQATAPLSSRDLMDNSGVRELGVDDRQVTYELRNLSTMKRPPFPVKRIYAPYGPNGKWAYYNPEVVTPPEARRKPVDVPAAGSPAEPVNGVNSTPDFDFNPLVFADAHHAASAANVSVPPGVRSITLSVSGVTVKIDIA